VRKAGGIRAAQARGLQTEGRKRILTEAAAFGASLCAGQQRPANRPARASRGKPLILLILFQTNGLKGGMVPRKGLSAWNIRASKFKSLAYPSTQSLYQSNVPTSIAPDLPPVLLLRRQKQHLTLSISARLSKLALSRSMQCLEIGTTIARSEPITESASDH
jgi:hypothetical protein